MEKTILTQLSEHFISLSETLGQLNANMQQVLEKLTQHENRLSDLERNTKYNNNEKDSFKEWLIKKLILAGMFLIGIISTLTGASGLISHFF